MFEQIRVAVVDSHPMFRAGIAHVLTTVGKCEIVAEGAGTEDAFRIRGNGIPDVLILDLDSESSVDTNATAREPVPCVRTMILTVIAMSTRYLRLCGRGRHIYAEGSFRDRACRGCPPGAWR